MSRTVSGAHIFSIRWSYWLLVIAVALSLSMFSRALTQAFALPYNSLTKTHCQKSGKTGCFAAGSEIQFKVLENQSYPIQIVIKDGL